MFLQCAISFFFFFGGGGGGTQFPSLYETLIFFMVSASEPVRERRHIKDLTIGSSGKSNIPWVYYEILVLQAWSAGAYHGRRTCRNHSLMGFSNAFLDITVIKNLITFSKSFS